MKVRRYIIIIFHVLIQDYIKIRPLKTSAELHEFLLKYERKHEVECGRVLESRELAIMDLILPREMSLGKAVVKIVFEDKLMSLKALIEMGIRRVKEGIFKIVVKIVITLLLSSSLR